MGKENLEDTLLRKVQVFNEPVAAISESINTAAFKLTQLDVQNASLSSPVMKQLGNLSTVQATEPAITDIQTAYNEVGFKLSSNSGKRSKQLKSAKEKHSQRFKLNQEQQQYAAQPAAANITFQDLKNLDLSVFTLGNEKSSVYKKIADNYKALHDALNLIPAYVTAYENEAASKPNPTQPEQEELNACMAKIKALYDIQAYYSVQEKLMSNKYFEYLPQDEVDKLSYKELRRRLDKLYSEQNRNDDLIDYYQNLIRLKEIGLKNTKSSIQDRVKEYASALRGSAQKIDSRDPKSEMKKIASAYKDMLSVTGGKKSIASAESYKAVFFNTHAADLETFLPQITKPSAEVSALRTDYLAYKAALSAKSAQSAQPVQSLSLDDHTQTFLKTKAPSGKDVLKTDTADASEGIELTAGQKKGLDLIGAWLIRHNKGHYAFVFNMLKMPAEQRLLTFYMIENDVRERAAKADYFTALNNYEPDLEKFKSKMDWNNISFAVRTATKYGAEMSAYGNLVKRIKDHQDRELNSPNSTDDKKKDEIVKAIQYRGILLKMLYRSAGLHDDMPPDMAQDPVLRRRLFEEYNKIIELAGKLQALHPAQPAQVASGDYSSTDLKDKHDLLDDKPGSVNFDDVKDSFDIVNEYYTNDTVGGIQNIFSSMGGAVAINSHPITVGANLAVGGLTALGAFIGAVFSAHAIKVSDTLTTADRVGQSIATGAGFVESLGGLLSISGDITNLVKVGITPAESWIGKASEALWASSNVGDKIAFGGGVLGVVAGTAKTVASGIQEVRSISNRIDVHDARKTIKEKEKQGQQLTDDEKQLKLFLNHQARTANREIVSATIGMVTGIMTTVAGGLAMSGYLAPIGALVGLATLTVDLIHKGCSYAAKKADHKKTVDEFLQTDSLIHLVKSDQNHPLHDKIEAMKESDLKSAVREEALAMLGFVSYEQCYKDICIDMATLLYNKVFVDNPQDPNVADYEKAISSLGMKIKKPVTANDEPKPTIKDMVAKMTE